MFIPKKSKILEKLEEQSSIVKEGAEILREIVTDLEKLKSGCARLEILETKADEFVHEITDEIERVFILPLDKEDVKELTERLDDIMDNIEEVANRLSLYKVSEKNEAAIKFSELILMSVQEIQHGILMIKDHKFQDDNFTLICEKIHDLENQGDKLHRKILGEIMDRPSSNLTYGDLLSLIKWQEIFQKLENTLDLCEDFAVIFGRLKIKYR